MRQVTAWVTADDQVFTDQRKAEHHAEERYGAELLKLAVELTHTDGKHSRIIEVLERNVGRMHKIWALACDRNVQDEPGD